MMKPHIFGILMCAVLAQAGFSLANETRAWAVPDPWMADGPGQLSINVPSDHQGVRIEIYGSDGTFVRALVPAPQEGGAELWLWDGRDDEGMLMPAGTYLVRVCSRIKGLETSQVFPVRLLRRAR